MTGNKMKNESGASLIELLLAVAIFSVLILAATGIFRMVVQGQRSAIAAQNVQENIRYAMEKMSKEMRMAQISNDDCLAGAVYKVFNTDKDDSELYFKNQYGNCVVYYLDGDRLKIALGDGSGNLTADGYVTPDKVKVSGLKFFIDDDEIGAFPGRQPYVTMKMVIKAGGQVMHRQEMKIQLTASSRYYE